MSETDKRAIALWTNAARSLKNYQQYIDRKRTKYELTLIDLLYISNFKGGNASIHEEEGIVNTRLYGYSNLLAKAVADFDGEKLEDLDLIRTLHLIELCSQFLLLTKSKETVIYGFKSSYASALLHALLSDSNSYT